MTEHKRGHYEFKKNEQFDEFDRWMTNGKIGKNKRTFVLAKLNDTLNAKDAEIKRLKEEIKDRADTERSMAKAIVEDGDQIKALKEELVQTRDYWSELYSTVFHQRDRYREALEKVIDYYDNQHAVGNIHYHHPAYRYAQDALSESEPLKEDGDEKSIARK